MFSFGSPQPIGEDAQWRQQLDWFVREHQQELAALSWGLFLEKGESDGTLGIDLQPTPHFVFCPKSTIEKLNERVNNQIQEILGFIDAHDPEKQVLILGIGNGQIKLIQFEIEPPPPVCFEDIASNVDDLLGRLEQRLSEYVQG
jgi:hypothetical protein